MTDIDTTPEEDWQQTLDSKIDIGGGRYKRLGDCNEADLKAAIEASKTLAESLRSEADSYERAAAARAKQEVRG